MRCSRAAIRAIWLATPALTGVWNSVPSVEMPRASDTTPPSANTHVPASTIAPPDAAVRAPALARRRRGQGDGRGHHGGRGVQQADQVAVGVDVDRSVAEDEREREQDRG